MSKGKFFALLVFCLSFAVVFGGWFLTKEMLDRKAAGILAEKGQISVETAETSTNENNTIEEGFEGEALTEDMIAEVLVVWEAGGHEVFHEPMAGQMNMEQAINAGRDWIDMLAGNNILPSCLSKCSFDNTSAVLYTLDSNVPLEESLISCWKVAYAEGDIKIILKIHALSGQVWSADVSMNEDKMLFGTLSDEEILAAAFPFLMGGDIEMTGGNSELYKISEKRMVHAVLKRGSVLINKEEPRARLFMYLCAE